MSEEETNVSEARSGATFLPAGDAAGQALDEDDLIVRPRGSRLRRARSVLLGAAGLAVVAYLVYAMATSPNVSWGVVASFFHNSKILAGLLVTLELTVLAAVCGGVLGVLLALMRVTRNAVLRTIASVYIWFFRGTPLLVQVIFLYDIALFIPQVGIGPFSASTNTLVTPFVAGLLALSLNNAAYVCEIVRGGIVSVDRGQIDAALALGLTPQRAMNRVVLPQALRVILPAYGNLFIELVKATSLVSVIGLQELLTTAENIAENNYRVVELLIVACMWYLIVTTLLTLGQQRLERYLGRSTGASVPGRSLRQALGLGFLLRRGHVS